MQFLFLKSKILGKIMSKKLVRIHDPKNLAGKDLFKLDKKIEFAMAALAHRPNNGGNPLLFAICAGKRHVLSDMPTAATDAVNFYWGVDFLKSLKPSQVLTVLKHEALHVLLMHTEQIKGTIYPRAFNMAIDFIVNSVIEREWRLHESNPTYSLDHKFEKGKHPLWQGALGKTVSFEELKELFKKDKKEIELLLKSLKDSESKKEEQEQEQEQKQEQEEHSCPACGDKKEKPGAMILVDLSLLGRPAADIYKEIKEWYDSLSKDLQDLIDKFGFGLDQHMQGNRSKEQSIKDLLRAYGMAKQLRGTIPSEIEELLGELHDPTLNLSEFLDQSIKRVSVEGGSKANYSYYRRRFISQNFYYPKYMKGRPTGVIMLDTSGSMSEKDISDGVSEITQFAGAADLYIVPVDATPHWNAVTKVTKSSDFKRIKVVGRGGTVFEEFFRDYKFKLRKYGSIDFIIVITDGYCDYINPAYTPNCNVGWVLTQPIKDFQQPFGKVLRLKEVEI